MKGEAESKNIFTKQFKVLYLQYAGELIFFARKFVDNHTAEDIVHEIFLKIWDKKSTVIVETDFKSYLFSMVQHACYDYLKHQTVKDTFLNNAVTQLKLEELEYYESAKDILWDKDKMDIVYASIEKLPPKCRDIFKKAYLEEQKHTDIAKELNISVRTVETHIYKALKFLRNDLTLPIIIFFIF